MNPSLKICLSLVCLATSPLIAPAHAADPPLGGLTFNTGAETRFQRALTRYIHGNYLEARQEFQELIEQFPPNQRTSAARLMLAKSHYKLKEYNLSIAAAYELYEHFPYSRYLPEADLVTGDCYFHQGQIYSAAAQYARILTGKGDTRLKTRAADRLGQMAGTDRLTDRDIARLKSDFGRAIVEEAVAFGQARWPRKLGRPEESARKLALFLERYPNGLFASPARQTLRPRPRKEVAIAPAKKDTPSPEIPLEPAHARFKVGIIAPMETPLGLDLRDGILLAREQNPLASGDQVGLVIQDSEGDVIRAAQATQRLIDQHGVIAIIGALTSQETTPMAFLAGERGVPLIAPTASEDRITSISPYVFQMNATPGAQGRRIADYAVRKLGLRTLVTLATRDSYGDRITKEFTARAEELGAEVIVQEWYEPETTDYRGQFERIREAGLALHILETFAGEIDSLLLAGIRVAPPPPVPVDPDTVQPEPVETLDGFLIAGEREDILLIAPQVAFHRIQAQLLGSDGWNFPEVARDGGDYVEGAIFVAKYHDQSELPSVREFVDTFRSRFGRDQNIVAALGYDAMLTVLRAINAGGTTRESLRERLETLSGIPGATGKIAFSRGNRENAWMYLLTIRRGKIMPLLDATLDDIQEEP